MTVMAQDPAVTTEGRIVTARLRVPTERLEAGPRGHRFHVVDYDATSGAFTPPLALGGETDRFANVDDARLVGDFGFHAQNAYAIAARTLTRFESALGRRIPWAFRGHQLFLVPHAFAEANAYYSDQDRALYFGYLPDAGAGPVYSCLSHDIVAHETTHAILDGFRPRYQEPSLPDQAAFHEAFADIVALLSVISIQEIVERLLGDADAQGRIPVERLDEKQLTETALFGLAEQFGDALHAERGGGLRRSVRITPSASWRTDPAFDEPHRRGEVLVAAFTRTLLRMWLERLQPLRTSDRVDRARAAEEGATAAGHLLAMAIRSLDYTPPVELEFEDFLDAVYVADAELVPDDDHHYRRSLTQAFEEFGIRRPTPGITDLTGLLGPSSRQPLHFDALRTDRDEVFRLLWENTQPLGLDPTAYTQVERVRPTVRVAPDGFVISESVADYIQLLAGTASELAALGLQIPAGVPADAQIQLQGGGTVVFDQFGGPKFHHAKPLADWDRQGRRLAYLARTGVKDTRGRYGFSFGTPRGQWFADFHRPDPRVDEDW
jgi:hypothetical protein